ncbi:MAG: hypothetical protein Q4A04_08490 [Eubacteriales bacterium]|nr:hypothetical protein [Eubacteriales bacterium]
MTVEEKRKKAAALIRDLFYYMEHFIRIRDKKGKIIDFKFRPAQKKLYEIIERERAAGKPVRIVILKARQLGFSTMIEGMYFQNAATRHNIRTLIVAHDDEATSNLHKMNKLFYEELPAPIKPMMKASNARELLFENPTRDPLEKMKNPGFKSSIRCVPATGSSVGRSYTLTNVHASEAAFWPRMYDVFTALFQAVPAEPGTSIIVETTPNGFNEFKKFWDDSVAGNTDFIPLFFPWYEDPDYRKPVAPGTKWTAEELKMKELYGLDEEQLSWRRWCITNNMAGQEEQFKQEYPSNPEEAFLMSGNPFFDNNVVIDRMVELEKVPELLKRGRYVFEEAENHKPENWRFVEDLHGEVYIYAEPERWTPYVAGGDTAGDGSDRFTAHVIDNTTCMQCAQILYDGIGELYYAQQVYCLGMDYNRALLGVEINYSTYPEAMLEDWGYPHLFIREKPDDSRGILDTFKLGWRTDLRTRPLILGTLQTYVKESPDIFKSEELMREMLTFVRNRDMRPEAAPGKHDDLVMAAAICLYIRDQQSYAESEEQTPAQNKLIDKLDPKHRYRRRR